MIGGELTGSATYPAVSFSAYNTRPQPTCGEYQNRSQSGGDQGTALTVTKRWQMYQSHYYFDTSGITDTVTSAKYKFKQCCWDNLGASAGVDYILLKSEYDNDVPNISVITGPTGSVSYRDNYNNFTGHTAGWDSDDVTEYSTEHNSNTIFSTSSTSTSSILEPAISDLVDDEVVLNSTAKTDIKNNDEFAFAIVEHDMVYQNDASAGGNVGGLIINKTQLMYGFQVDDTTTSQRPYLEVTTGTVSTPTENATFFGANF